MRRLRSHRGAAPVRHHVDDNQRGGKHDGDAENDAGIKAGAHRDEQRGPRQAPGRREQPQASGEADEPGYALPTQHLRR